MKRLLGSVSASLPSSRGSWSPGWILEGPERTLDGEAEARGQGPAQDHIVIRKVGNVGL